MTCRYCSNDPRHPCRSEKEASKCGNCDDVTQGMHLDLDKEDVIKWLKYRMEPYEEGTEAVRVIESLL